MKLPDIIKLRILLWQRQRSSLSAISVGLVGPIIGLSCYGVYDTIHRLNVNSDIVAPILNIIILGWFVIVLIRQFSLTHDRKWIQFTDHFPIRPIDLLLLHFYVATIPVFFIAIPVLITVFVSVGVPSSGAKAALVLTVLLTVILWTCAVPVSVALWLSRIHWAFRATTILLAIWILFLVFTPFVSTGYLDSSWSHYIDNDPVIRFLSLAPLTDLVLANPTNASATWIILGYIGLSVSAICGSGHLLHRRPVPLRAHPLGFVLFKNLQHRIAHLAPMSSIAEVYIEFIRTIRSANHRLALLTLLFSVGIFHLQAHFASGEYIAAMPLLFAMCAVSVQTGVLNNRKANHLYLTCGAQPKVYFAGVVLASTFLITLGCMLQIIFLAQYGWGGWSGWEWIFQWMAICIATVLCSFGPTVTFRNQPQRFALYNRAIIILFVSAFIFKLPEMTILAALLHLKIIPLPSLFCGVLFSMVSFAFPNGGFFTMVIGVAVFSLQVRQLSGQSVRRDHWRMTS